MRYDLMTGEVCDYRTCMYCKKRVKMFAKEQTDVIRIYCSVCGRDDEIIYKRD